MKRLFLATLMLSLFQISCSKKEEEPKEKPPIVDNTSYEPQASPMSPPPSTDQPVATDDISAGKSLVEGADCLACHKIDAKLVGPAYQDVAAKYTDADIDHLAQKIIDGGKGVWGDVPMTAHAGMSKENAQKMVKYILSLKK
ncbi:c-type cytochrome [Epilithonimonas mollis]|uniref:Cytochrome c n=1 Tax=Epilithonimonas mollis TaxID=216903 RepID=A0A1M6UAP2_9FLAO|nr:c-type cytochrome [Epilithonimonas mollis]SHK66233.1 cytochrome c [Epilithonimonas mollis]